MMLSAVSVMAAYYVAGNGASGNPWCDGKYWVINGSAMTDQGDGTWAVTFQSVPTGSYEFKVTNGTNTWYGANKFSQNCSNISCYGSDNIQFTLSEAQDLTVTFNGSKICLQGSKGEAEPDPEEIGAVGVPAEYEGVMMQGFYWESYVLSTFHRTKYIDLISYADAIGTNFDLIWLPPSGQGGGVGYYTKCYSNLDTDWGTRAKLLELIGKLHEHDCKVLADVVINHHASNNGWAKSFAVNNFGKYGSYQIKSKYICSGDECFTNSSSDSKNLEKGASDTGTNDGGCRDLDHTNEYVQKMCKAYTQWLLNTIGFDGFRYDMTLGYAGKYLSMYNLASKPFFSVSECWDNAEVIKSHLIAANYNTLAFDFPTKYKFNDWKGGANYYSLRNPGLRLKGLTKYAVTFIDNHDTFHRSDNQGGEFLGYNTDISQKKRQIVEANAYLLMMPGVPCVFWPHWYTFPDDINQLIAIRKKAGIHSESKVTGELASSNKYKATITGHRAQIFLRMGSSREDYPAPEGFTLELAGDNFDIFITEPTPVENVNAQPVATKIIDNGTMFILKDGTRYTVDGRKAE